jgi:hypothetical protein
VGFTDLHAISYQGILNGIGFGLKDVKQYVKIVHQIRNNEISQKREKHPFCS